MDNEQRLLLHYLEGMAIGALAAALAVLMTQLAGPDALSWRPILAAALGPIVTGLVAMQLPRTGSATLNAEAGTWRNLGYHRRDLTLTRKPGAVPDDPKLPSCTATPVEEEER